MHILQFTICVHVYNIQLRKNQRMLCNIQYNRLVMYPLTIALRNHSCWNSTHTLLTLTVTCVHFEGDSYTATSVYYSRYILKAAQQGGIGFLSQ